MREMGQQREERQSGPAAFGLELLSDLAPPGAWEAHPASGPVLRLARMTPQQIAERWSGLREVGWQGTIDGAPFVAERGMAGDHRFVHGAHPDEHGTPDAETRAVHHLSPDLGLLLCAPSDPDDQSWWRVVLDSVLFTIALLHGYEALHAAAIATSEGAIAIAAGTGGGKSTLVSELVGRGLTLMADDVLVLAHRGANEANAKGAHASAHTSTHTGDIRTSDPPLAYPAPPLMTVPAGRLPVLEQAGPVEPIAAIGEERWIAVPVYPEPLPLRALVVLNRRPGLATGLHRVQRPLPALLDSLLSYPRARARERTRFEMAAAIAEHASVWRLDADPGVAPAASADRLLAELAAPLPARARDRRALV